MLTVAASAKFQGNIVQKSRKLEDYLIERPQPQGMDVLCGLKHFAIITYAVPVDRFQGLFPERFQLDSVEVNGQKMGLISVVPLDRKSTRLNSSHVRISYAVFCLKKKKKK